MIIDAAPLLGLGVAALALAVALSNVLLRAHRPQPPVDAARFASEPPPPRRRPVEDTLPLTAGARHRHRSPAPTPAPAPHPEGIQVAEPLLEADAAGAAGFYREVAALLQAQLERNPARLDLHFKLLEVYGAAGETDAFVQSARAYLERSKGTVDSHWPEIARMGRVLLPGHEAFAEADGGRPPVRFQRFYEAANPARLKEALRALGAGHEAARQDPAFSEALGKATADMLRRPTSLTPVPLVPEGLGGAMVYAKREDQRGAEDERIINALGQCLMAQHLGRSRVVSATQDGLHGLAVASVAARLGIGCVIYMAEPNYRRHYARTLQMRRLGAEVLTVPPAASGEAPWLAALRGWLEDPDATQFVSSLAAGPHPFPAIVRDFQSVVGQEALGQLRAAGGRPPRAVVAGMADGYVGLGLLNAFLAETDVALYCVEASPDDPPRHLREHGWLRASRRVQYVTATDDEALDVVETLFRASGMCVPTEAARTLACARRLAAAQPDGIVLSLMASPPA